MTAVEGKAPLLLLLLPLPAQDTTLDDRYAPTGATGLEPGGVRDARGTRDD
jgi:hypothetical protein